MRHRGRLYGKCCSSESVTVNGDHEAPTVDGAAVSAEKPLNAGSILAAGKFHDVQYHWQHRH